MSDQKFYLKNQLPKTGGFTIDPFVFRNVTDMINFMQRQLEPKFLNEYLTHESFVKPYFDVDCYCNEVYSQDLNEDIITNFYSLFESYFNINYENICILSASGKDNKTGKTKYSYHFIICGLGGLKMIKMNEIVADINRYAVEQEIDNKFPSLIWSKNKQNKNQIFDDSVYKSTQNFRCIGCAKINDPNRLFKHVEFEDTPHKFVDYIIQYTDSNKEFNWKPKYLNDDLEKTQIINKQENKHEIGLEITKSEVITLLKSKDYWNESLQFLKINKHNEVIFKGTIPYYCLVCNRNHVKFNNNSCVKKTDTGIYFICRPGNSILLQSNEPKELFKGKCLLDDDKDNIEDDNSKLIKGKCLLDDDNSIINVEKQKLSVGKKIKNKISLKEMLNFDENHVYENFIYFNKRTGKYAVRNTENLIKYLNRFLALWIKATKPTIVELDFESTTYSYVLRTYNAFVGMYPRIKLALEEWWYSKDKRKVTEITWVPYTLHKPCNNPKILNVFSGFKHKVPKDLTKRSITPKIAPILNQIKKYWCKNDEKLYNYTISWLAHKAQKPNIKIGTALVLKSIVQGAGKNIIIDYFKEYVFGQSFCTSTSNIEDILGKFNAKFEKVILVSLDEAQNKGAAYKMSDRLKDIITRTRKPIEYKGVDSFDRDDYVDCIFTSNCDWVVKVESSCRRYVCMDLDCGAIYVEGYFKNIENICYNDDSGREMFEYLLTYDISEWDKDKIPTTDWKRQLREKSIDPITSCIINLIKHNLKSADTKWHISEFETEYNNIPKAKSMDIGNLGKQLSNVLGITSQKIEKNKIKRAGFKISIEELKDKVKILLKDNDYDFDIQEESNMDSDIIFDGCQVD
jgi:Family of unknown function (DUF5906)